MAVNSWTDADRLRRQYASAGNLATRVGIYRYLVDDRDPGGTFEEWVLDHHDWAGDETVLDVGRGAGAYEPALAQRAGRTVGLDLSPGMLAHVTLPAPRRLVAGDAQRLPVADGAVDVVLAAHMLYHVPDIGRALTEARRVLRPGGTALLVANGAADKGEISSLWQEAAAAVAPTTFTMPGWRDRFAVDSHLDAVRRVFPDCRVDLLTGVFRFPTPEPVMAWVGSLRDGTEDVIPAAAWDAVAAELEARIRQRMDRDGEFVVHKASGVIVAR